MIITKTPFRMSFFGGGSDMPEFFRDERGAVLSTTFDKYCYVTVRHLPPFFEYTTELSYSIQERVRKVEDLQHPAVRNAMQMLDMHELHIAYDADLPARTGLGTSSSFAVGMLYAFHCLKGRYASKRQLADESIYLERVLCGESGGWQDQIAASFGGFNRIEFHDNDYSIHPLIISPERKIALNNNLLLFFTGFSRFSSDVQKASKPMDEKKRELRRMVELVDDATRILSDNNSSLDDFGYLLNETWMLKKSTGKAVSNSEVDQLYERAISAGALGGKLLGAGGGGFLLFYVSDGKQENVKQALNNLLHVPFCFENDGTSVVYYSPEPYDMNSRRDLE